VVAAPPGILALDTATLSQTALATDPPYTLNTSALAMGSGGHTLYALGQDSNAPGANRGSFVAIDTATGQLRVIADGLQDPATLVLSRDGNSAYFTDADPANGTASVFSVDLNTGIQRRLSTINSRSLAVTFDGKLLVITDVSNNRVQALDTADGSVEWTMSPAGGATPLAVAAAANGSDIYLVASAVGEGPTLAALDERGRVIQTTPLKLDVPEIGALSIGVKPQGDRVYVAATGRVANNTIAMDPAGSRLLVRASTQVSSVPVGSRQPSAWTLTAGAITPQSPQPVYLESRPCSPTFHLAGCRNCPTLLPRSHCAGCRAVEFIQENRRRRPRRRRGRSALAGHGWHAAAHRLTDHSDRKSAPHPTGTLHPTCECRTDRSASSSSRRHRRFADRLAAIQ